MFQIIGQALLIAVRQDVGATGAARHSDRPTQAETRRSRWFTRTDAQA